VAEKTGFILYYDMLENLKTLGNDIVVEVLSALSKYDQGIEVGDLSPQAQFAFNTYIPAMKKAKLRWETSVANGNLHKSNKNKDKPSNNLNEPNDNLHEANQNLAGGVNGNDTVNENDNENGDGNGEKPPPLLFIKNKIETLGFFLDDNDAIERLITEMDPAWLYGNHTFVNFIAETVRQEYGDKPKREQHRVFRKLLFDAPNLREAYPEWCQQKEMDDAKRTGEEALEAARRKAPEVCQNCGAKLRLWDGTWVCDSCNAQYTFNEGSRKWDYHGPPPGGSLSEQYRQQNRNKGEKVDVHLSGN